MPQGLKLAPEIADPLIEKQAWLRPENDSVFDSSLETMVKSVIRLLGLDDPNTAPQGLMAPMIPAGGEAGPLGKVLQSVGKKIKAYHGSPHDFDKFSMDKIGSGEGAQAYGHGLYFAENEGTANQYKNVLGGRAVTARGERLAHSASPKDAVERRALEYFSHEAMGGEDAVTALEARARQYSDPLSQKAADLVKAWKAKGAVLEHPGKMYEVSINADPETFLDWDKPLSQQPQNVQAIANKAYGNVQPVKVRDGWYSVTSVGPDGVGRTMSQDILESSPEAAMQRFEEWKQSDVGRNIYENLTRRIRKPGAFPEITIPDRAKTSETLRQAGIPGIKYLDQGSRSAGEGTSNYVVFDDSLVSILRKYGVALGVIEGLKHQAAANGGQVSTADVQQAVQQ